jgi:MFS family permease
MPVIKFTCPSCGAELKAAAEKVGRKGKCAKCGCLFTIPSSAPRLQATATPDDPPRDAPLSPGTASKQPTAGRSLAGSESEQRDIDETDAETEEQDRPRHRTDVGAEWRKVSLGLLLILIATGVGLATSLFGCVSGFAISFSRNPSSSQHGLFFIMVAGISIGLLRQLATLAGYALCYFVPLQGGFRNLVVAALVVGGVGMAVDVVLGVVAWRDMRTSLKALEQFEEITRRPPERSTTKDPQQALQEMQQQVQQQLEASVRSSRIHQFSTHLRLLLSTAQYLTFAFFLLGLARSQQASATAEKCLILIRLSAVLVLVQVMTQVVSGVMLLSLSFLTLMRVIGVFAQFVSLLGLAQIGWFFMVLLEVRGLVNEQVRRRVRRKKPH